MKPLVIYHSPCQDGFTAAWACWKSHPDWEYYPAKHGDPPPDVKNRSVFMLDFSYKFPVINNMLNEVASLTILDHHKTAEAELKLFETRATADCISHLKVVFDMDKSGARLAWEYFHPSAFVPLLVRLVEDRDLWKFQYPQTKAFSSALFAEEYKFEIWDQWHEDLVNTVGALTGFTMAGEAILKKHFKDINEILQNKFRIKIRGHEVWACNLPYTLCSDAGNILAQNEKFGATFYLDGTSAHFSLRSTENGTDVSEIAKQFGGGGHKHAAGFKVPFPFNLEGE